MARHSPGGAVVAAMAVLLVPRLRRPAAPEARPAVESSARAGRRPAADPLRLRASERVPPRRPGKESAAVEGPGQLTAEQARRP